MGKSKRSREVVDTTSQSKDNSIPIISTAPTPKKRSRDLFDEDSAPDDDEGDLNSFLFKFCSELASQKRAREPLDDHETQAGNDMDDNLLGWSSLGPVKKSRRKNKDKDVRASKKPNLAESKEVIPRRLVFHGPMLTTEAKIAKEKDEKITEQQSQIKYLKTEVKGYKRRNKFLWAMLVDKMHKIGELNEMMAEDETKIARLKALQVRGCECRKPMDDDEEEEEKGDDDVVAASESDDDDDDDDVRQLAMMGHTFGCDL